MAESHEQFKHRLLRSLLAGAERHALPAIAQVSSQLARALSVEVVSAGREGRLSVPHYWAVYVHDGRPPFGPVRAKVLVWFRNPKDDPRLNNGEAPVRAASVRHLTKEQFYDWLAINDQARARGEPTPMVVAGVHPGNAPHPFFSNLPPDGGMAAFAREGKRVATQMTRDHIIQTLKDRRVLRHRDVIRIRR